LTVIISKASSKAISATQRTWKCRLLSCTTHCSCTHSCG